MSGKASSAERAAEKDGELDAFERGLGLPTLHPDAVSEASRLLSMRPGDLGKMTAGECSESAVILMQYAAFIQRAANREQSRARWAEESARAMVASQIGRQQGQGYPERLLQAVRNNESASALDRIRVDALTRLDRIAYVSARVDGLAKALMGMASRRAMGE